MSAPARALPSKVQAIGLLQVAGGVLNLVTAGSWVVMGLSLGLMTLGVGLLACCPALLLLPLGVLEIAGGARHLGHDHRGLGPPRGTAMLQVASVLGCSLFSGIAGVLTLVFLSDPEVAAWYEENLLDAERTPAGAPRG